MGVKLDLLWYEAKKSIDSHIHSLIDARIGKGILHSKFRNKNMYIGEHSFYVVFQRKEYYDFEAEEEGIISDINLTLLQEIVDRQEKIAPKGLGRSSVSEDKIIVFPRDLLDYVYKGSSFFMHVDKRMLLNDQDIKDIKRLIKKTFIIKPIGVFGGEAKTDPVFLGISDIKKTIHSCS